MHQASERISTVRYANPTQEAALHPCAIRLRAVDFSVNLSHALQAEAERAALGAGDCELDLLEPDLGPPAAPCGDLSPDSPPTSESEPRPFHPSFVKVGPGKKNADKARRKGHRFIAKQQQPGRPRSSLSKKHAKPLHIKVDYDARSMPAAKGAFVSLRPKVRTEKEWTLDELLAAGFDEIKWDGW